MPSDALDHRLHLRRGGDFRGGRRGRYWRTLQEVLDAGLRGARLGYDEGTRVGDPTSVASVEKRMELAIQIGSRGKSWEDTMLERGSIIGSGIAVNEAVPCVFGILAATNGAVMSGIRMGVNVEMIRTP
jgi:ADP-ribosylglycohydrolase